MENGRFTDKGYQILPIKNMEMFHFARSKSYIGDTIIIDMWNHQTFTEFLFKNPGGMDGDIFSKTRDIPIIFP